MVHVLNSKLPIQQHPQRLSNGSVFSMRTLLLQRNTGHSNVLLAFCQELNLLRDFKESDLGGTI